MSAPHMQRRTSKRLERKAEAAPYSKSGSTGLTSYMEKQSLDWKDEGKGGVGSGSGAGSKDVLEPSRSISLFGGKRKEKAPKLPPNWKKAKDKDGKIYYYNTVTQQRTHEVPPALPKGWREALHKESGRVYYYHKDTRQSTFEFPIDDHADGADNDDDMSEAEPPEPPEGFIGRTISKFTGRGKTGVKKGATADTGLERTGTMSRSTTLSRGKKAAKGGDSVSKGSKEGSGGGGGDGDGSGQKTVFISCSTLIKEVKLCVGSEQHSKLDELYDKLTSHAIPAEQAVRLLMEQVGSTIVQQAGLSVMNAQKGLLPHGWLEYTDEASGRPYYYNVHSKVTTWYKPTGAVPPPPPDLMELSGKEGGGSSGGMVNIECSLATHSVAMTGFI